MKEYKINPTFKNILPEHSQEEKDSLRKNILMYGCNKNSIKVWNDQIIDGHLCYEICKEEGIDFEVEEWNFKDEGKVVLWIVQTHLARRNLGPVQRIQLALKYEAFYKEMAKKNQSQAGKDRHRRSDEKKSVHQEKEMASEDKDDLKSDENQLMPELAEAEMIALDVGENKKKNAIVMEKLAKLACVGKETFRKCKKVLDKGSEELKQQMEKGEKTINAAYEELMAQKPENSDKVIPFQVKYDYECIWDNYNKYAKGLNSLLKYDFLYDGGEMATENIKSDIEGLLELAKDVQKRLKGMTLEKTGFIKLAANQ